MSDHATATTPATLCTAAKVRRLAREVSRIYDAALAPHGLTIGQMGLLASLSRRRGVPIHRLAEATAADPSTISRLIKPLVDAGLAVVEVDPEDRRNRLVRLTEAGAERRRDAGKGWSEAQRTVAARLGDGRLAALRFLLDEAHERLSQPVQLQDFTDA